MSPTWWPRKRYVLHSRNAGPSPFLARSTSGAGRQRRAAADDRVRAQIAGVRIGDVHRSALAFAVAGLLAEQLGEHEIGYRAFREAVSVAAMRARDVVISSQRLADADGHRLLAYI